MADWQSISSLQRILCSFVIFFVVVSYEIILVYSISRLTMGSRKSSKASKRTKGTKGSKGSKLRLIKITKSTKADKKMMAVFEKNGRQITRHFGAKNYSDYTIHKDAERKQRYDKRHRSRETWTDPTTPGALSKYILWNKPSLRASIADYKRRFKL